MVNAITVTLPLRTVSEANARGHWTKRAKRAKTQRSITWLALRVPLAESPVRIRLRGAVVTLTRIAPRELDDDNLRGSLKACRDGVADALGINDRDPRVEWRYAQARGRVREYAVVVTVEGPS